MQICERFHLSPFELRRETLCEFCLLVKRLNKHIDAAIKKAPAKKDPKAKNFVPVTDYKPIKKGVE